MDNGRDGRDGRSGRRLADTRGVSPVVGKALEAGIVVLYVGLLTATLYGGVVPDYRTAAGSEVGERILSKSAHRVQQSIPPSATSVRVRTRVSLPGTIRGRSYEIRAENQSLVLSHPNDAVATTTKLALPDSVASVRGAWSSGDSALVAVRSGPGGLVVELREGDDR